MENFPFIHKPLTSEVKHHTQAFSRLHGDLSPDPSSVFSFSLLRSKSRPQTLSQLRATLARVLATLSATVQTLWCLITRVTWVLSEPLRLLVQLLCLCAPRRPFRTSPALHRFLRMHGKIKSMSERLATAQTTENTIRLRVKNASTFLTVLNLLRSLTSKKRKQ